MLGNTPLSSTSPKATRHQKTAAKMSESNWALSHTVDVRTDIYSVEITSLHKLEILFRQFMSFVLHPLVF